MVINVGGNSKELFIGNIQVNKAMKGHRRTFRAHGRVNAFLSHPCHIYLWLVQNAMTVMVWWVGG